MLTASAQPASLHRNRHRLRLAAFGLWMLVGTLGVGLHLSGSAASPFARLPGDDLIPSYMAGTFVRQGRPDLLMDYPAAERFQADLRRANGLEQHGRTGPWLNPPFYAWVFVPLSAMPYPLALAAWAAVNLGLLAASVAMLHRMLPADRRRQGDAMLVGGLLVISFPGIQVLACQQNTFLSLCILCGTVTLWRGGRATAAGAVAGLLCFKPQLAAIVWLALACSLRWRAVAGIALSAGLLVGASLVAMPGAWADYLTKLPTLIPSLRTDRPYFWERQVTFVGFWRLLLLGRAGGPNPLLVTALWAAGAAVIGALLATPAWRAVRGRLSGIGRDRWIAATVAASPLLMPYYMDYDLLLLAVPVTLLAAERMAGGRADTRWLVAGWAATYGCLYLNATVGVETYVSVTVPAVAVLAGCTAWRAGRAVDAVEPMDGSGRQDVDPAVSADSKLPRRAAA
ncbi:MAG TPA: glycosyltransferase family 87 protein [Humisphaera sp.]